MAASFRSLHVLGFLLITFLFQEVFIYAQFVIGVEPHENKASQNPQKENIEIPGSSQQKDADVDVANSNTDITGKANGGGNVQLPEGHTPEKSDGRATSPNSENGQYGLFSFEALLKPIIEELKDGFGSLDKSQNITAPENVSVVDVQKNVTEPNPEVPKNVTDEGKKMKFHCDGKNVTENNSSVVHIINSTELLKLLSFDKNNSISDCILVMFFAPWCQFSAKTAPNFNALARAFPQLHVTAVDAAQFSNLNARFGTVSVPNILLFHQSRAVMRYNNTDRSLEAMITFFSNFTGLTPNTSVTVEEIDFSGPVPSVPTDDADYLLWLSWIFVIVFSIYVFTNSNYGQQSLNKIRILWQEHQHID